MALILFYFAFNMVAVWAIRSWVRNWLSRQDEAASGAEEPSYRPAAGHSVLAEG